jgi:hypothetical protein
LLGVVAVDRDGETQLAVGGHRREEKIIGRVPAKIKNVLPDAATVPFHPGRQRAAIGDGIG